MLTFVEDRKLYAAEKERHFPNVKDESKQALKRRKGDMGWVETERCIRKDANAHAKKEEKSEIKTDVRSFECATVRAVRNDSSGDTPRNDESDTESWKGPDGVARREDGLFIDETSADGGPVSNDEASSADPGGFGWREGLETREADRQKEMFHIQKDGVWIGNMR